MADCAACVVIWINGVPCYRFCNLSAGHAEPHAYNTSSANVTGANEALVEESVEALQRIQSPKRSSAK